MSSPAQPGTYIGQTAASDGQVWTWNGAIWELLLDETRPLGDVDRFDTVIEGE
jgi:hypothetical protein